MALDGRLMALVDFLAGQLFAFSRKMTVWKKKFYFMLVVAFTLVFVKVRLRLGKIVKNAFE